MKKLLFVLSLALPLAFAFAFRPAPPTLTPCEAPENIRETISTANSVTFMWDAVDDEANYVVYCEREADEYVSEKAKVKGGAYTFSELPSGEYKFYFAAVCGDVVSEFAVAKGEIAE